MSVRKAGSASFANNALLRFGPQDAMARPFKIEAKALYNARGPQTPQRNFRRIATGYDRLAQTFWRLSALQPLSYGGFKESRPPVGNQRDAPDVLITSAHFSVSIFMKSPNFAPEFAAT